MRGLSDYFAAGKKLNFWAAAFSARATGESAWLLLGLTGMGAAVGMKAMWVVVGEVLGVAGGWLLLSRRFKRLTDRYDSLTIPDYLESRFQDSSHLLRMISAGALTIFVTIYVSAQIDATGTAFESFLGWNYFVGALVGFSIVMIYSTCGGFLAVVWSDIFQGTLMFFGLVLLPIYGLWLIGGIGELSDGLTLQDPMLLSLWGAEGFTIHTILSIVAFVGIGAGFLGSPQVFVRFLALRSEDEIRKGALVAVAFTVLTDTGAVLLGMVGRYLLMGPGQEVEAVLGVGAQEVLPLYVETFLHPLLIGLVIAIVLSATMSTVDSLLVVASSAFVRDYYQKVKHPELSDQSLLSLSRKATLVLSFIALGVALTVAITTPDRTIFWFVIFGWSGIAATFCPTMVLSLFWSRFTRMGAMSAMLTGFLSVPFFKFIAPHIPGFGTYFEALEELVPAFLLSTIVGVLVSKLVPPCAEDLANFERDILFASDEK